MIWFVIGFALGLVAGAFGMAVLVAAGRDDDEQGRPRG